MARKLKLEELGRLNLKEFNDSPKIPVTVVLDNIRSAMNVGSVFRSCDAFAIEKIYLCGITAIPPHREISKTAIGATESVVWEQIISAKECIAKLKGEGKYILGIEQTDESMPLNTLALAINNPITLVFGNEVEGLTQEILTQMDQFIEISQFGTKHSLNIAVCAGIVIWHVRQCLMKQI